MIAIIDYGLGNIKAFANVYKRLNIPHKAASSPNDLKGATKFILPGVGAFDHAMQLLQSSGMRELLDEFVLQRKVSILGICVGMQILAHSSEEGSLPGLGWIDGVVRKFDPAMLIHKTHLPHMGWNDISPMRNNGLLQGLNDKSRFYFLHSYYFDCSSSEDVIATTDYGRAFPCIVNSGNVYGVQFHPEKSHQHGIQLLQNFGNL
jgi:glutamine amidotransferase